MIFLILVQISRLSNWSRITSDTDHLTTLMKLFFCKKSSTKLIHVACHCMTMSISLICIIFILAYFRNWSIFPHFNTTDKFYIEIVPHFVVMLNPEYCPKYIEVTLVWAGTFFILFSNIYVRWKLLVGITIVNFVNYLCFSTKKLTIFSKLISEIYISGLTRNRPKISKNIIEIMSTTITRLLLKFSNRFEFYYQISGIV